MSYVSKNQYVFYSWFSLFNTLLKSSKMVDVTNLRKTCRTKNCTITILRAQLT